MVTKATGKDQFGRDQPMGGLNRLEMKFAVNGFQTKLPQCRVEDLGPRLFYDRDQRLSNQVTIPSYNAYVT